jgi:transposase
MVKEIKLVKKVKHLLNRIGAPKRLHRFGPKIYSLWQHVFALFVKANCCFSYRRTTHFLRSLGFKVATKSTLQRYAAKIRLPFWQRLFAETISKDNKVVCMDGTGLERSKTSQHYIRRIDGNMPFSKAFHFGIIVGENSKILSLRIRKKYTHDMNDARYLAKRLPNKPDIIIMDKGYDSEKLHEYFAEQNIWSIAPVKKNWAKGQLRKKLKDNFPKKIYGKRNRVESVFHAFKQKFGANINSKNIAPARSEVYCKTILHNLFFRTIQLLGQTPNFSNLSNKELASLTIVRS